MRKDISNMSMFAGLSVPASNGVVDPDFVPNESEMMRVLSEVFSVDPVSGLPKGALSYYLSPDGNPQVKAWLENNLLKPRAISVGSSIEGVTDDMIEEMQRLPNESNFDYAKRMRGIFDDCAKFIKEHKYDKNE